MRHFLFEKNYEIDPKYQRPRHDTARNMMKLGIAYHFTKNYLNNKNSSSSNSNRSYQSSSYDKRQNCTVKTHYSTSMDAHKEQINRYLVREGAGKDGNKAVLYGMSVEEYKKDMVDKNFRIFLSPENQKIPLDILTKKFMMKLTLQTGYKFSWVAANHYNTAHEHTHILINGVDQFGKDIIFSKDLITTIMRDTTRDLCTSMLGCRTNEEIQRSKDKLLEANRFTRTDEIMSKFMASNILFLDQVNNGHKEIYARRCHHLAKIGLCNFINNNYHFEKNWKETLKTLSRYNMFLDAKRHLKYTNQRNYFLYESKYGKINGIVTKIYKTDDISDNHAAVIETFTGKAYFVPLFYKPKFRIGEQIQIVPKVNQKGRLTPSWHYTKTQNQNEQER